MRYTEVIRQGNTMSLALIYIIVSFTMHNRDYAVSHSTALDGMLAVTMYNETVRVRSDVQR